MRTVRGRGRAIGGVGNGSCGWIGHGVSLILSKGCIRIRLIGKADANRVVSYTLLKIQT